MCVQMMKENLFKSTSLTLVSIKLFFFSIDAKRAVNTGIFSRATWNENIDIHWKFQQYLEDWIAYHYSMGGAKQTMSSSKIHG